MIKKEVIVKTSIKYTEPKSTGVYARGAKYWVKVTTEEEEPGRGCVHCARCVEACTHNLNDPESGYGVFTMEMVYYDIEGNRVKAGEDDEIHLIEKILWINPDECCNCKRCVKMCPQRAIKVYKNPDYHDIGVEFTDSTVINNCLMRANGESTVSSAHLGLQKSKLSSDWLIDAAEILSPQRDHLHEYAGKFDNMFLGKRKAKFKCETPIFDVHMSYGSNSHEAFLARLMASIKLGRPFFTGEGYLHPDMMPAAKYCILQFGSGGYGPWVELDKFAGISMKYGQDAKKGKGGRLQAKKNDIEIALLRCVEALRDLTSPNPQHLQYSIEELPMRVESLRALLGDEKLIGADVYGTAWNFTEIVVALAKAGFDYITIKAGDGSTGAAHYVDLQNKGLNVVYLTHIADLALRKEGLREQVSIISEGGVLDSFHAFLVLLAGADFVGMGMRTLHPLGCTLCQRCHTGQCAWGITSRQYGDRIDPEIASEYIVNMIKSFQKDMEGLAAGLGMSSHADVVGARRFRYHGNDPLLFQTFGIEDFEKQVSNVAIRERNHKVFKTYDMIYRENEGLINECLSKIEGDFLKIDVQVSEIDSRTLNLIMKMAVERGVKRFYLDNVVGQRLIGTGVKCEEITVRGLVGNHSFAFVRDVKINVIPNHSTKTTIPANVQVGVANTSNPKEINIAGDVSDLFAAYAVSGKFRVAKSGGVRNLLLMKAGLPREWAELDLSKYEYYEKNDILEELLIKYQKRKSLCSKMSWEQFLETFEKRLNERKPPVAIYGVGYEKGMGDYFMEYAQGGIGIVLNVVDMDNPMGYYICSGMTAGAAYIRGNIKESQLGVGVKKIDYLTEEDKKFLENEIIEFLDYFLNVDIDEEYNKKLRMFAERFYNNKEDIFSDFHKIIPVSSRDSDSPFS
ncbi:glutamate synthase [Deferribacter autotrophicus]|uniref:glutamate synthase (NADPH) n=1 Tax=Deferribacter autotrophicus TaxID=500465 RepID=A0A5A8F8W8_9BACT|nr:glutamate synthase-related protein [Deferribacter autotrophicus]KAA0259167.1 glutamate synthase [Deferribacter autotrophicus]